MAHASEPESQTMPQDIVFSNQATETQVYSLDAAEKLLPGGADTNADVAEKQTKQFLSDLFQDDPEKFEAIVKAAGLQEQKTKHNLSLEMVFSH